LQASSFAVRNGIDFSYRDVGMAAMSSNKLFLAAAGL